MAAVSNEDISVAFAHDQLLDDQQSGHVEADSPHFLSIAPGIFKSAKFGIVRKLCQAGARLFYNSRSSSRSSSRRSSCCLTGMSLSL